MGHLRDPSERGGGGSFESAGKVLGALLAQWGLAGSLARYSLVTDWPRMVEPSLARHAKAHKIVDSTLYVIVDSSVWMNELAALKMVLLEKINSSLPSGTPPIRDIRFQQRSWGFGSNEEPGESPVPAPDEERQHTVSKILAPLEDEELRSVIIRILEKDRRLKWRREHK